jgi:hypothetical protein
MTSARPSILLDCDPGHDDVVVIVVAAQLSDLVGKRSGLATRARVDQRRFHDLTAEGEPAAGAGGVSRLV